MWDKEVGFERRHPVNTQRFITFLQPLCNLFKVASLEKLYTEYIVDAALEQGCIKVA